MVKKRLLCNVCVFLISSFVFSQVITKPIVSVYGSASNAKDTDTLVLTQNLFFTQLINSGRFIVHDLRKTIYTPELLEKSESTDFVFYMDIIQEDLAWTCILHLINIETKKDITLSRKYPGYYKILMEAKDSIFSLLQKYDLEQDSFVQNSNSQINTNISETDSENQISIEKMAGTWNGDENIDKIVLMKSGRGFIIFRNGASMSVSVTIVNNIITIKQTTRSNASFFPELPRDIALLTATKEVPIYWEFTMLDSNTLEGTKHTLIPKIEGEKITETEPGTIPVKWTR
ncbi:MAG: hypothetical protein BKP49_09060 [Treponema sp. CETP13]|nr:MAG: hypothetical protein BKP49_09060 [Treponema sp. CETP13]